MSILNQQLVLSDEILNTASTNPISANNFLNLNEALLDLINEKNITLKELGDLSPAVTFDTISADLLDDYDYINYDKTQPSELNILFNNQLIENLIGTDFYYLSTNGTERLSGVLIDSKQSVFNFFNVNNATTNSIPVTSNMFEKEIGGFYLPNKQSILKLTGKYDYYIDENLEKDKIYSFPNPNMQGNVAGLSKEAIESPLKFSSKKSEFKNISSSYGRRNAKSSNYDQNFYAYDSLEQKRLNNNINFNSEFDREISNLINYGLITNINYDIYGNGFVEFLRDSSIINNIKVDSTLNSGAFNNSETVSAKENLLYRNKNLKFPKIIEREEKIKNTFVINKFNNTFTPLSTEFSKVFDEYKVIPILYKELKDSVEDIKIYKDIFTIKTKNYYLIDNINYDDGNYTRGNTGSLILDNSKLENDQLLFGISNDYIVKDIIYKARITKLQNDSKRNDIFNYEVFGYNTATKEVIELLNIKNTPTQVFYDNFNLNLDRIPHKIVNVALSSNKKLNMFNLVTQYNDLNDNIFIHSLSFKITKNKITFEENDIYTPSNYFSTSNFYKINELLTNYSSTISSYQDFEQGVILL
jgi:hypothetical protein